MSETPNTTPSAAPAGKKSKERSPGYAGISLRRAMELAQKLWDTDKRQAVLSGRAALNLGFSAKSSAGMIALAAMKKYGLLEEEGAGELRKVKLTDTGIALLNPSAANRSELLKRAALSPNIHAALWEKYRNEASKGTIHDFLVFERKYNEDAARIVIAVYFDTIAFANLVEGDTVLSNGNQENESPDIASESPSATAAPASPVRAPLPQNRPPQPPPAVTTSFPSPNELPIPVGENMIARIPFPMSEEDFELFVGTLNLWKKKITKKPEKVPDGGDTPAEQ